MNLQGAMQTMISCHFATSSKKVQSPIPFNSYPPADAIWRSISYCKSKKYLGATMSRFAKLIRQHSLQVYKARIYPVSMYPRATVAPTVNCMWVPHQGAMIQTTFCHKKATKIFFSKHFGISSISHSSTRKPRLSYHF